MSKGFEITEADQLDEEIAIASTEQVLAGCKCDLLWTLFHVRNTRTLLAMAKRALSPAPAEVALEDLRELLEPHKSYSAAAKALREKWPNGVRFNGGK